MVTAVFLDPMVSLLRPFSDADYEELASWLERRRTGICDVVELEGFLTALVIGRYFNRGGGVTNVVWGLIFSFPALMGAVMGTGGCVLFLTRNRALSRRLGIGSLPFWVLFIIKDQELFLSAFILAGTLVIIDTMLQDDLPMAHLLTLDMKLDASTVGDKAANLSLLKRKGFLVPMGWVLPVFGNIDVFGT